MAKQAHLQEAIHPNLLLEGVNHPLETCQFFSLDYTGSLVNFFFLSKTRWIPSLDFGTRHTRTQPFCPPQPLYKRIFKHHLALTFFPQLTEYLRSDMLTSTPVDLFRFSSWDTTTCSSFVRWQSSSNMSVPILTALEAKRSALNHTCILYRSKPNIHVIQLN